MKLFKKKKKKGKSFEGAVDGVDEEVISQINIMNASSHHSGKSSGWGVWSNHAVDVCTSQELKNEKFQSSMGQLAEENQEGGSSSSFSEDSFAQPSSRHRNTTSMNSSDFDRSARISVGEVYTVSEEEEGEEVIYDTEYGNSATEKSHEQVIVAEDEERIEISKKKKKKKKDRASRSKSPKRGINKSASAKVSPKTKTSKPRKSNSDSLIPPPNISPLAAADVESSPKQEKKKKSKKKNSPKSPKTSNTDDETKKKRSSHSSKSKKNRRLSKKLFKSGDSSKLLDSTKTLDLDDSPSNLLKQKVQAPDKRPTVDMDAVGAIHGDDATSDAARNALRRAGVYTEEFANVYTQELTKQPSFTQRIRRSFERPSISSKRRSSSRAA